MSAPENDACRNAPSPPMPSSTTTTRRVDSEGNANTPSSAANAPASAPNTSGNPTRLAAIAPTAPSASATGIATTRHGEANAFVFTRAPPRPANRAAAGPAHRRPRAEPAPEVARVDDGCRHRPPGLARAAPEGSAGGERCPADAGRAARGRLDVFPLTVEIHDQGHADRRRRLVLAYDERAATRARGPMDEARRITRNVRTHRTHRVTGALAHRRRHRRHAVAGSVVQPRRRARRPRRNRHRDRKLDASDPRPDENAERRRRPELDAHRGEHAALGGDARDHTVGR